MLDGRRISVNAPEPKIATTQLDVFARNPVENVTRNNSAHRGKRAWQPAFALLRFGKHFRDWLPVVAFPSFEQMFRLAPRESAVFKGQLCTGSLRR